MHSSNKGCKKHVDESIAHDIKKTFFGRRENSGPHCGKKNPWFQKGEVQQLAQTGLWKPRVAKVLQGYGNASGK